MPASTTRVQVCTPEDIESFARLSQRSGIGLTGLMRQPDDYEHFLRTVAFWLRASGLDQPTRRADILHKLRHFLATDAQWFNDSVEALLLALVSAGFLKPAGYQRWVSVVRATDSAMTLSQVRLSWYWQQIEQESAKNAHKARMKSRNVNLNRRETVVIRADWDKAHMQLALQAAQQAQVAGDVPVGAVLAKGNEVIAVTGNRVMQDHQPTAHAEMLAIMQAAQVLGNERLNETTLYVTLEPCAMCAAAIAHARIARVVWAADDPERGAMLSACNVAERCHMNHQAQMSHGLLREQAQTMLQDFFQKKRRNHSEKSRSDDSGAR